MAENTFAAIKGRSKRTVEWVWSAAYRKTMEEAARAPGKVVRKNGDVDAAMAKAAKKISAEYCIPHLAQAPQVARENLAKHFGMPLDIANILVENPEVAAHTRVGWFRSVSNIPHAFAIQSFIAELAAAAQRDHKDYLLELLGVPPVAPALVNALFAVTGKRIRSLSIRDQLAT